MSHGILSGKAIERIRDCSVIKEVLITDTIPLDQSKRINKIKVVSVGSILADAIQRIHDEESISCLFDGTTR